MNFTTEINDESLGEIKKNYPHITIIRVVNKETDPKDDGLRMPYPHESKTKVKKAKKKKKK
jgi:F-box and leucine-rich repeat protein 2/20